MSTSHQVRGTNAALDCPFIVLLGLDYCIAFVTLYMCLNFHLYTELSAMTLYAFEVLLMT